MADQKRGCLGSLLGIGGSSQKALTGPTLPALVTTPYDPIDRPAVARAHRAAERCLAAVRAHSSNLSAEVVGSVQSEVILLIEQIHRLGAETTAGRKWLVAHDADAIAKRRTDLELEALTADIHEKRSIDQAMASLDAQRAAVAGVRAEVDKMAAALIAAGQQVEAMEARLQQLTLRGSEEGTSNAVIDAVRAQHAELSSTVDAFSATLRELG